MHTGAHPARAEAVSTVHRQALAPAWEEGWRHEELPPLAILVRLVRVKYCLRFPGTKRQTICLCSRVRVRGCAGGARARWGYGKRGALLRAQGGLTRPSLSERWVRKKQYEPRLFLQLTSPVFYFQRLVCKAGSTRFGSIFNLDYFNWDLGMGK